ncbi:MAG: SH3 domain-containing protein [Cohaesibacteraceae bacterium]
MIRLILVCLLIGTTAAYAEQLDVPIVADCAADQAACYPTSRVSGMSAHGEGFLAVRSGPGTGYRQIGKLFNNDVVKVISHQGVWHGVRLPYGGYGWVHSNWLRHLAG